jgi:hypothetical protein
MREREGKRKLSRWANVSNLPKFTSKVPNMWDKCGGTNVLPPNSIYL